jgi:hypothetical protein
MNRVRRCAFPLCVLAVLVLAPRKLHAQLLTSLSNPALAIVTPTETHYDAGASASTASYTIVTTCIGLGGGCRLFVQYGTNSQGQQVDTKWALTSAPSAQCRNLPALNVFNDVVPTNVVLTTLANEICTATFVLRVSPLSYATYTSPGPASGAYVQQVKFVFTRP